MLEFKRPHRSFMFIWRISKEREYDRSELQTDQWVTIFSEGSHEILNCIQKPLFSGDSHLLKPAAVYPARRSLMVYRFLSKISLKSLKLKFCIVTSAAHSALSSSPSIFKHVISLSALKLSEVWNQFGVTNIGWSVKSQKGPSAWKCES